MSEIVITYAISIGWYAFMAEGVGGGVPDEHLLSLGSLAHSLTHPTHSPTRPTKIQLRPNAFCISRHDCNLR